MRTAFVSLGLAFILGACTRVGAPVPTPPESSADAPSSFVPAPSPTLAIEEPLPSDPAIRHAVELRRSLGLRSDVGYVQSVAADPRAQTAWLDIPLLPEEEAELAASEAEFETIASAVNEYAGSHRDEFGGVYIDRETNAGVVSLWTGHLDEHEAGIRARLAPGARAVFRKVTYSEEYLRSLQDRIVADRDWLASIPAVFETAGVDVIRNVTVMSVSSINPAAVQLIEAHYGLGPALEATSDGTGAALIPWGTVEGRLRTPAGSTPDRADYFLRWHSDGPGDCGGGDVGYGVSDAGTFSIPCQQGTWTIDVTVPGGDGWRSIGQGTVDVLANRTSKLDIVLAGAP